MTSEQRSFTLKLSIVLLLIVLVIVVGSILRAYLAASYVEDLMFSLPIPR